MSTSSRYYYKNCQTLEVDTVTLFFSLSFGAGGAVLKASGAGLASAAKSAVGVYDLKLEDKFSRVLSIKHVPISLAPSSFVSMQLVHDEALFQDEIKGGAPLTIGLVDDTGALIDPAAGSGMLIEVTLRSSSVNRFDK